MDDPRTASRNVLHKPWEGGSVAISTIGSFILGVGGLVGGAIGVIGVVFINAAVGDALEGIDIDHGKGDIAG